MAHTDKPLSERDANQTLQSAYNDVDASLTTNGFLVGKVGHKVTMTLETTSSANDTELYTFFNGGTQLYEIKVIYTDGTRAIISSAERIS